MLSLLKKILQVGEATVKYPFAPAELAPGVRGKPVYNYSLCIACGACANACPANAITITNDMEKGKRNWEIFFGRCIFCGRCEEVCPTRALTLTNDFELAAAKRDDLVTTAEFDLLKCQNCGQFFSPSREISWLFAFFSKQGLSKSELIEKHAILYNCPECRRAMAIESYQKAMSIAKEEVTK
jgi:hydrogenase-4 component H